MAKRIVIFIFLLPFFSSAQNDAPSTVAPLGKVYQGLQLPEKAIVVHATVYNGETIPYVTLTPLVCYVPRVFKNRKEAAKWDRLKYNVKKVYPYAILASAKLKEYDKLLAKIPNENERKKYMKLAEKQLKDEFGNELKKLTMTQGRILIKLVDRETGKTTYDIVKDMRGSFSAFMWQGVAVLFSSNLKDDYDAKGEDKAIEEAIKLIEGGDF
ncbi:MAG: DUF4294 domain-containing protein [Bacteroidia bacterium]|nr:DUF4294 domain-containing protein [Bacteroidia bacterium]